MSEYGLSNHYQNYHQNHSEILQSGIGLEVSPEWYCELCLFLRGHQILENDWELVYTHFNLHIKGFSAIKFSQYYVVYVVSWCVGIKGLHPCRGERIHSYLISRVCVILVQSASEDLNSAEVSGFPKEVFNNQPISRYLVLPVKDLT